MKWAKLNRILETWQCIDTMNVIVIIRFLTICDHHICGIGGKSIGATTHLQWLCTIKVWWFYIWYIKVWKQKIQIIICIKNQIMKINVGMKYYYYSEMMKEHLQINNMVRITTHWCYNEGIIQNKVTTSRIWISSIFNILLK